MATERCGSSVADVACCSRSNASRYGAGDGLLSGVSPAATIVAKRSSSPAASMISTISWRSAPDAIAIGTAAAAARMNSAAPGNSTSPAAASPAASPLRATSSVTCDRSTPCRDPAPAPRTSRRRRSRGSGRSTRPARARCLPRQRLLKAFRCSGSLLAITPSKSNTIACSAAVTRRAFAATLGGAFSPARIATFSRFEAGGYGHSYVGLYAQVRVVGAVEVDHVEAGRVGADPGNVPRSMSRFPSSDPRTARKAS